MPPASAAREKVLDAFESILISQGERTATLEAVAAEAGVSKGGLLYHFGSKQALAEGLVERLDALVTADVEAMRAAPDGPAAFYVRTSGYTGSRLDRAIVATSRLAQGAYAEAQEGLTRTRGRWLETLTEQLDDPAVAHAVMLIGDGLYYHAVLSGEWATDDDKDALLAVVDRLVKQPAGA